MPNIRKKFIEGNFSTESTDIIVKSWRPKTAKRYNTYIKQWKVFCRERQINPISPSLSEAIEFMTTIFKTGVSYSSLATARSALSSLLNTQNGVTFGSQPIIQRFMKGAFNS